MEETDRATVRIGGGTMSRTSHIASAGGQRESGFAMLIAMFALLIMSTVAVAALISSDDERRSSRAVRSASMSFYGAEAGLHRVWADSAWVDSLLTGKFTVAPGGSRSLGWRTMTNGVQYNTTLRRYDNGGQLIYGLVAEGRGARGLAGQQVVTFLMTSVPGTGGYKLGACCAAAAQIRGDLKLKDTAKIDGNDGNPASWVTNGRCTGFPTPVNKPGVIMKDTTQITRDGGTTLAGSPPKVQNAAMDSTVFLQYGGITFAQLKAMANHTIDGTSKEKAINLAPSLNGDGTCKTSDPYNWGSNDPAHACYNYFPIILIKGEVEVKSGYGQGIVIMDLWSTANPAIGSEFELEATSTSTIFAGIILGFGCPEIQNGHGMFGAVYADKLTANQTCGSDRSLQMDDSSLQWSNCVVQTVLQMTGVAVASGGGPPPGGLTRVSRGFVTSLR
jgi:hypothetical protein